MRSLGNTWLLIGSACLVTLVTSCDEPEPVEEQPSGVASQPSETESITRTVGSGPIAATVVVTPESPILGDPIIVTLTVEADPGIDFELPAFGEALGRFSIVDFTPREEMRPDGGAVSSQQYTLQPPMSGRQRIPPLRITFVDNRPDQTSVDEVDGHELLTDEIAIQIASVLPEDAPLDSLRRARGSLPLEIETPGSIGPWIWVGGATGLLAMVLLILLLRRAASIRRRRTAYDIAMGRLDRLEDRGLPKGEQVDDWYVELSDIMRRYLENRFGLRAPELTTEEFLQEARQSPDLTNEQRSSLSNFLERCDQVKFAGYRPPGRESVTALTDIRVFLEETRYREAIQDTAAQPA